MAEADEPEVLEDVPISVKLPPDVTRSNAPAYLAELAAKISDADGVALVEAASDGRGSDAGGRWQDATLTIYPSIICGGKKPGDGDGDDDDDSDDSPG